MWHFILLAIHICIHITSRYADLSRNLEFYFLKFIFVILFQLGELDGMIILNVTFHSVGKSYLYSHNLQVCWLDQELEILALGIYFCHLAIFLHIMLINGVTNGRTCELYSCWKVTELKMVCKQVLIILLTFNMEVKLKLLCVQGQLITTQNNTRHGFLNKNIVSENGPQKDS